MQRNDLNKEGYKFTDEKHELLLVLEKEFQYLPAKGPERDENIRLREKLLGLN